MNDLQQDIVVSALLQRLDMINSKQNILIEQVSALSRVIAKQCGLAIEDGEMECVYIDESERFNNEG